MGREFDSHILVAMLDSMLRRIDRLETIAYGQGRILEVDRINKPQPALVTSYEAPEGITRKSVTLAEQQMFAELYKEGRSAKQIADQTGWSTQTVINQLKRIGVGIRTRARNLNGDTQY